MISNPRSTIVSEARSQARRALRYLRDAIEDADLSQRELEDRLGWGRGYLSQLLNGYVDLKLRHLEALLEGLSLSPADSFHHLFPRPSRRRRRGRRPNLKINEDVVRVYSFGVEAICSLCRRLEQCEEITRDVAQQVHPDGDPREAESR